MKISVIIPTFNRRHLLARTLPTVFAQDFPSEEYEVVVVVDGSTDGTVDVLRGFKPAAEFRILEQPNRGPAVAKNAGVRAARGELVLFLDDDLVSDRSLLKEHATAHEGNDPAVVLGSTWEAKRSQPTVVADWMRTILDEYFVRLERGALPPGPRHAWVGPNTSIPHSLLMACGGYDEHLRARRMEDIDLGLRLWKMGVPFRYEPKAITYHVSEKSARGIVRQDARWDGRSMLLLCRKHPDYRPYAPLAGLSAVAGWKRLIRRTLTRSPLSADRLLSFPYWILEQGGSITRARRAAVRLLEVRSNLELVRSAVQEAGSWEALYAQFWLRLPVLLYHHVGPPRQGTGPDLTISPEQFERQVGWLARHGYVGISPSDWLAWRRDGKALPAKPILLTFDDAYADTAEYAFPILKRSGFSAGVFVVTSQVGGTNAWDEAQGSEVHRLMSAGQIRAWAAQGIEFGAHSRTHADLTTLGERELAEEVAGSAQDLSAILGTRVVSFAYPYGTYNEAVRQCAEASFALAFTCEEGLNTLGTDPHLLRRTNISPREGMTGFRLRTRLGWNPLLRLRARLRSRAQVLRRRLFERRE